MLNIGLFYFKFIFMGSILELERQGKSGRFLFYSFEKLTVDCIQSFLFQSYSKNTTFIITLSCIFT